MIYIASPFFNEKQLELVKLIETTLNKNRIPYYSPRSEGTLGDMSEEERQAWKKSIYLKNVCNICDCSLMVAVIDDRDIGTIWEMGYATSAGKPIISLSNSNHGLNVMLAESVQAHVLSVDDMMHAIMDPEYKGQLQTGVV